MWNHQLPKIIFLEYNEQEPVQVQIVLVQQAGCILPAMLMPGLVIKKIDYKTITQANQFEIFPGEHSPGIFNTVNTSIVTEDPHFTFKPYWLISAHQWLTLPRYLTASRLNAE